jgi:penicillin-binding protein 2
MSKRNPFEGRRRWKAREPKRESAPNARTLTVSAGLRALIILMFGILVIQLINLQVIHGENYKQQSAINAIREVPTSAARGLIYDREGRPLVTNSARFAATIIPGDLPEEDPESVYALLGGVIDMPPAEIALRVEAGIETGGEYAPAVVKTDIDRDTALVLMELAPHTPGLHVEVDPARTYLTGDLLSHVMGYIGPITAEEFAELEDEGYGYQDYIGKSGVEATYETILRGKSGKKLIEVDAAGRELRTISERPPIDGTNVVLSIDLDLQLQVTDILKQYSESSLNAAAAVMDVHTGELLAFVSLPSYDNNIFSTAISDEQLNKLLNDPGKPLVDHLIAEQYPPGSTFKTIVGLAALQEGVAVPGTTITSRGYITIENEFDPNVVYVYPDWAPLGALDFYGGVAMSSDVYFYYLAGGVPKEGFIGLGEDKVAEYARAFGLGSPTGIDIPGEAEGLVPDAEWKQETIGDPWALGDTYNYGIGQGYVAATPIQMLNVAAAVANGGKLLTPRLVSHFQDSAGNPLNAVETTVRGELPISQANLQVMRDAMRQSVTTGVARNAAAASVAVAGKTGTAEFGERRPDGSYDTHGWFIGFAPYDDPQIAVLVFVQNGTGGNDASPAAARIVDAYFAEPGAGPAPDPSGQPEPGGQPQDGSEPEPTLAPIPTPLPNITSAPAPLVPDTPTSTPEPEQTLEPTPEPTAEPPPETPDPQAQAADPARRRPT